METTFLKSAQQHVQPESKKTISSSTVSYRPPQPVCTTAPPPAYMFGLLACGGIWCCLCFPLIPLCVAWSSRSSAFSSIQHGRITDAEESYKNAYKWMKISIIVAAVFSVVYRVVGAVLFATDSLPEAFDELYDVGKPTVIGLEIGSLVVSLICLCLCWVAVSSHEKRKR